MFSTALQSHLYSLKQRSRRRSGRTLQAVHPHMSHAGLCYLSRPAADSHMSKPGERPLCALTGGAGMSKACIVQWNNDPPPAEAHANTHAPPCSNLDLQEHTHTHTHWHTQTGPQPSSSPQPPTYKYTQTLTHSFTPITTALCDPLANHQFFTPTCWSSVASSGRVR